MSDTDQVREPPSPLAGVRVLDLSRVLAGPYATMILGDMGADVVKVERPDGGDDTRRFGPPFVGGESTYFLSVNRNKRSLALGLKDPRGRELLWRLVERADVLVENFRPGTLAALGFGWEACARHNPRLVYASISAFGQEGDPEWTRRPGYDLILQGMGGIPSLTGPPDGGPAKSGASVADVVGGMVALQGILLALYARERTGRGQRVDASLLEGQLSLLTWIASGWLNAGQAPRRAGNRHPSVAPYGTYSVRDGWLNLAVANDAQWRRFCRALGREDLAADPRFETNPLRAEGAPALDAEIQGALSTRTVAEWTRVLDAEGVPAGPVLDVERALSHPQVLARGLLVEQSHPTLGTVRTVGPPLRLSEAPAVAGQPPPRLGEHTREVLAEIGCDGEEVEALIAAGVAAVPGPG
ncbi:CoA transferase [Myxococcota bacterium]|nr:CoA transferase [Myxococcota bacterium]